jgi:hypothetical protein
MSRIARDHRILARALVTAAVAAVAVTAPASASAVPHADLPYAAKTCGGPNEIVQCKPPVKSHSAAATDTLLAPTCGGPNEIVQCKPPVEARPHRPEAVRSA